VNTRISIDNLIEIVRTGGRVKTGVDVYNHEGLLLLDKNVLVEKVRILEIIKDNGIHSIPVSKALNGGLWDGDGNLINFNSEGMIAIEESDNQVTPDEMMKSLKEDTIFPARATNEVETKLLEIEEIKKQAAKQYRNAKKAVKQVLTDIKETGGEFDYDEVEKNVSKLVEFLVVSDNPFSYLAQEMLSYDDYLYNHSVNVCAIGTAVINRFNINFSKIVDDLLKSNTPDIYNPFEKEAEKCTSSFTCYYSDDLTDISLGFFLHDIGKVIVADEILNKEGRLTPFEFDEVKKHSYEYGTRLLDRNQIKNSVVKNIVNYHHAQLYEGEERCYPLDKHPSQIPLYIKVCKLSDIYDAMTSRRCYKEAINPINVVTQLFRSYAKKDYILQYILHAFVKSIGIYPAGSIVFLKNGQMAYVLESTGPLVIPFTDNKGNTLRQIPDPIDTSLPEAESLKKIDNKRSVRTPKDVYTVLPSYIKKILERP